MNARFRVTAAACSMVLALTACGDDDADDGSGGASASTGSPASSGNGGDGSGAAGASASSGGSGGAGATGGGGSGGTDIGQIAAELDGYRIELPCTNKDALSYGPGDTCPWDPVLDTNDDPTWALKIEDDKLIGGDAGVVYDVQLRIRGVTEPKRYTGGTKVGEHFYIGGEEELNDYNIYSLHVSDPEQTYYLTHNDGGTGHFMIEIDDTATVPMRGGATVRIGVYDHNDQAIANGEHFTIPGVPPDPDPFPGHLIQIDVLGVTEQP